MLSRAPSSATARSATEYVESAAIELRTICPAVAQLGAEDAQEMFVDGGLVHLAALCGGNKILRVHELGAGHFEIEAVVDCGDSVVGRVPIGHENALETPFALEHFDD